MLDIKSFCVLCVIILTQGPLSLAFSTSLHGANNNLNVDRRAALSSFGFIPLLWSQGSSIATAKVSIKPETAFNNLVKARKELDKASAYLVEKDFESLREYLNVDAVNINNYEENAGVLLASKQLDVESKIAIGTIRRYGVGADVIIMYGGVKTELDEGDDNLNYGNLSKSLKRTMDSLDEVISICRSNGF